MTTSFRAIPIEHGAAPESVDGLAVPSPTREALHKAGGALERTLYVAVAEVAEEMEGLDGTATEAAPVGYAMLLGYHRPHTAQQKLTAPGGDVALFPAVLEFAEHYETGAASKSSDGADAAAPSSGKTVKHFVKHDESADVGDHRHETAMVSHYRQTTEFTCGPVAVMDALYRLGVGPFPTRQAELALWREATMVVACDPYGLALAASRRGFTPVIWVSQDGPILDPNGGLGALDPALARDAQEEFLHQAREAGMEIRIGTFGAKEIGALIDEGHIVVLLIDELHMHGETCPHWVTVVGHQDGVFLIDDPWTDKEFGENAVDAYELPIEADDLDLMGSYQGRQAMLVF